MATRAQRAERQGQNINVFVRIRPLFAHEMSSGKSPCIEVLSRKDMLVKRDKEAKRYHFDRIFDHASSQKEVYEVIVSPLIKEVINGYNCTVFAYGQTGTGKTYTMAGGVPIDNQLDERAGIIPRSLSELFEQLETLNTENAVRISYLELYNEELFDLIATEPQAIRIFDDKNQKGSVIIHGLEEVSVSTRNEVYRILELGQEKRRTATTLMNANSSRSHTVLTIVVHTRETNPDGEELVKTGKLHLVDLAGSENIHRSGAVEQRAREAASINQSLLTLSRVITNLTIRNAHIPYRESKLTRILQDSLGGRTKTTLIANVSAAGMDADETAVALDYAMRARSIQNRPEVNQRMSRTALIHLYTEEIERLKRDLLASRTGTGVYLNEENYDRMIAENVSQKEELVSKMNCIRDLEARILEHTTRLTMVETSWAMTASNMEELQSAKRSLEEDLHLTKQEKEKQELELEEYKEQHQQLSTDKINLLSVVKEHQQTEESLQIKVSALYEASYHNIDVTKAFNDVYKKLNRDLLSRLDHCISFTVKKVVNGNENCLFVRDKLDETYCDLRDTLDQLNRVCNNIVAHKRHYAAVKEPIQFKITYYLDNLANVTNTSFEELTNFLKGFKAEKLRIILDNIKRIDSDNDTVFPVLLDTLIDIRNYICKLCERISDYVCTNNDNLQIKLKILMQHCNAARNYATLSNATIKEMQFDIMTMFDNLDVTLKGAREQFYAKHMQPVDDSCLTKVRKDMEEAGATFSDLLREYNVGIERVTEKHSASVLKLIDKTQTEIEILKKRNVTRLDATKEAAATVVSTLDKTNNSAVKLHERWVRELSMSKARVGESEKEYDDYFRTIDNLTQDIQERSNSAIVTVKDMYKTVYGVIGNIGRELSDAERELTNAQVFYNKHQSDMETLVTEFCDVRLKHPTHAGDTPQRGRSVANVPETSNVDTDDDLSFLRRPDSKLSVRAHKGSVVSDFSYKTAVSGVAPLRQDGVEVSDSDSHSEYQTVYESPTEEEGEERVLEEPALEEPAFEEIALEEPALEEPALEEPAQIEEPGQIEAPAQVEEPPQIEEPAQELQLIFAPPEVQPTTPVSKGPDGED